MQTDPTRHSSRQIAAASHVAQRPTLPARRHLSMFPLTAHEVILAPWKTAELSQGNRFHEATHPLL